MTTKFKVSTQPTTIHNYNSVAFFGAPQNTGGRIIFEKQFDVYADAEQYVLSRIQQYADFNGSDDEIQSMIEDVNTYGRCDYNGVVCLITETHE
jgi:hypothetical protein